MNGREWTTASRYDLLGLLTVHNYTIYDVAVLPGDCVTDCLQSVCPSFSYALVTKEISGSCSNLYSLTL